MTAVAGSLWPNGQGIGLPPRGPWFGPRGAGCLHGGSCDIVDFLQAACDGGGDGVWFGLGVVLVGGRVPVAYGRVFSGPAGVWPSAFGGHGSCLRWGGCGNGFLPQGSWLDCSGELSAGGGAGSHWAMRDRFPGGGACQLDLVNPW